MEKKEKNILKNAAGKQTEAKITKSPIAEAAMGPELEKKALKKAVEVMEAWADAPGNPANSNNWSHYASEGRRDVGKVLDAVKKEGKKAGGHIITANLYDAGYDYDDSRKGYTLRDLCSASSFVEGNTNAAEFLKKFDEAKGKTKSKESDDNKSVELYNKHKAKIECLKQEFTGRGQFGNAETQLNVDLMIKVFEKHPGAVSEITCRMPALANYADAQGFNASFELFNEMKNSDQVRRAAHILGEIAQLAHAPWIYVEVVDLLKKNVKNEKMLEQILMDDDIEYPTGEQLESVLKKYKGK